MLAGLYAKLIMAGLLVAALGGAYWYVHHLQAENTRLTSENTVLGAKIKDQNDAFDAFKKDADTRLQANEVKLAEAQAETAKAKMKANNAYKAKPSTPADLCKSALDLVNGGAK
jgi:hypothetical protein